jgi:putative hydrolase of the HAD superfamily
LIRNVIFDFGQVMVRFDPAYITAKYIEDPTDCKLVEEILFDRLYWDKLDAGTITDEEVIAASCDRLPKHLHGVAETVYRNWIYHLPDIAGMRELVKELKTRYGLHVYLLSNISTYFAAHAHEIPCLAEFDDCVFSAVCGKVKPNPDIFAYLCGRNGLNPQYRFTMFQFDYLGEKIIEYNGVQYTVYRTFNKSVDEIELYTELKKGNDVEESQSQ